MSKVDLKESVSLVQRWKGLSLIDLMSTIDFG